MVGKLKESLLQYSKEPYFSLKKKSQPKKVNRFLALFRNTTTFGLPGDQKGSPGATPKYSDSSQARKQKQQPDFKLVSPRPRPSSAGDAKAQLNEQLENYLVFKQHYDKFYKEFVKQAHGVQVEYIIKTYMDSHIRHQLLREGFKGREADKLDKVGTLTKLQEDLDACVEEERAVGEYLQSLDLDHEANFCDLFAARLRRRIEQSLIENENADEQRQVVPSLHVHQIYFDCLSVKLKDHAQVVKSKKLTLHRYWESIQACLRTLAARLHSMKAVSDDVFKSEFSDVEQIIAKLQVEKNVFASSLLSKNADRTHKAVRAGKRKPQSRVKTKYQQALQAKGLKRETSESRASDGGLVGYMKPDESSSS